MRRPPITHKHDLFSFKKAQVYVLMEKLHSSFFSLESWVSNGDIEKQIWLLRKLNNSSSLKKLFLAASNPTDAFNLMS